MKCHLCLPCESTSSDICFDIKEAQSSCDFKRLHKLCSGQDGAKVIKKPPPIDQYPAQAFSFLRSRTAQNIRLRCFAQLQNFIISRFMLEVKRDNILTDEPGLCKAVAFLSIWIEIDSHASAF